MIFEILKVPQAVDVIENRLEYMIFSGIIRPDTILLSERKISEQLKVSRTTIREALSRLQAKGLLEMTSKGLKASDVLESLLSESFQKLNGKGNLDLLQLWQYFTLSSIDIASKKITEIDKNALLKAEADLCNALKQKSTKNQYVMFYNYFMRLSEGCYNFFLQQTTHVILRGFEQYFQTCLSYCSLNEHLRSEFIRAIKSLTAGLFDGAEDQYSLFHLLENITKDEGISIKFNKTAYEVAFSPKEMAIEKVVEYWVENEFDVGDVFANSKQLANHLNLSQNAITLAFHQLETLKMIEICSKDSIRIISLIPPSKIDTFVDSILNHPFAIESIFEFRLLLDSQIGELSARNISDVNKDKLRKIFKKMDVSLETGSKNYSRLDFRFHQTIANSCGNVAFVILQNSFGIIVEKVIKNWLDLHMKYQGNNSEIHYQHGQICKYIIDQDPSNAKAETQKHINYVLKSLKEFEIKKLNSSISKIRSEISLSF